VCSQFLRGSTCGPFGAQVKMVTSDDEAVTDITVRCPGPARWPDMHLLRTLVIQLANLNVRAQVMGPDEEVERLRRELALLEKGKVPVKGLLET